MNISTQLKLTLLISAVSMAVAGAGLIATTQQLRQNLTKNEVAEEALRGATELRFLTFEYAIRHEERVLAQRRIRQASFSKLLDGATGLDGAEEREIVEDLRRGVESTNDLFGQIVANYAESINATGDAAILADIEARLAGQITNKTQTMIAHARHLSDISRAGVGTANRRANLASLAFAAIVIVIVGTLSWLVLRRMLTPLETLRKGAEIVGDGNLDHRLAIDATDEIGKLGRAFDEMTENLQRTTVSRDELVKANAALHAEIAVRRLAEAALQESRAWLESAPDALVMVDETGNMVLVNQRAEHLFGYSRRELLGNRVEMLLPERNRDRHPVHREGFFAAPHARPMGTGLKLHGRREDGSEFPVEVSLSPIQTKSGTVVIGAIRDIEERVLMEQRLEEETDYLRSIVESSGALIVLADRDGNIVMVNNGFTSMTGQSEPDVIGRPLAEVLPGPLESIGREPVKFAIKVSDAQGAERLVAITATPIIEPDGTLDNVVLLGVDDTERRDAEQMLHDAERFATVGEMAGTMAHEISQPLQVINLACASALGEYDDAAERGGSPDPTYVRGKLDRIAQQLQSASRILGDLRAFVRGGANEEAVVFDPLSAVESAVNLTGHGMRMAGIALSVVPGAGWPRVKGSVGRLEQVLVNLLNNARDAGGRTVDVVIGNVVSKGRNFARIVVEDSGPGVAVDVLPRLFVSFVTTKPRGKGTGLGLRICRRIIEEMGGSITASNRRGGGACFEIVLPAAAEEELAG